MKRKTRRRGANAAKQDIIDNQPSAKNRVPFYMTVLSSALLKIPALLAAIRAPWKYQDPHGVKFSTSVGSLAKQNSLKHNGCARLQRANGPNYSTAAFKQRFFRFKDSHGTSITDVGISDAPSEHLIMSSGEKDTCTAMTRTNDSNDSIKIKHTAQGQVNWGLVWGDRFFKDLSCMAPICLAVRQAGRQSSYSSAIHELPISYS